MPRSARALASVSALAAALACSSGPAARPAARDSALSVERVDDARLRAAADEPQSWLTYGGSYAEQRFSKLAQIDAKNVAKLGLAWTFDTQLPRGHEATPIVVDGVIYTTGSWTRGVPI